MEIENKLEKLKKEYILAGTKEHVEWGRLSAEMEDQKKPNFSFSRNLTLAGIILMILVGSLFGFAKAVNASAPGDKLYGLKRATENIIVGISGRDEIKVQNRAKEIIELANEKKDPVLIKKATDDYKKSVNESNEKISSPGRKQEFNKKLEDQEDQFDQTIKQEPSSEDSLKEAVRVSREGRGQGEVKGQKQKAPEKHEED